MSMPIRLAILVAACGILANCNGRGTNEGEERPFDSRIPSVDPATIARITEESIFFGHHSVGLNILEGVTELLASTQGNPLRIVESTDVNQAGSIYHSGVGKNGDPMSKISGFVTLMQNGIGDRADVAIFKFCYVDFGPQTDTSALFDSYKEAMESLQQSYPHTRFAHMTVPLTTKQWGVKVFLKRLLGRSVLDQESNLVRERFNRRIRDEYGSQDLVFDLARVESTLPDGRRVEFQRAGERYYALAPEYTDDGGHLNQLGRRRAAAEFLRVLASLRESGDRRD